jgi:hypothetical protein
VEFAPAKLRPPGPTAAGFFVSRSARGYARTSDYQECHARLDPGIQSQAVPSGLDRLIKPGDDSWRDGGRRAGELQNPVKQ